jgi:hypothetical protein
VVDQEFRAMPHPDSPLAKKINSFVQLSQSELGCLAKLQSEPFRVKRGKDLVHAGQTGHKAYILQTGWRRAQEVGRISGPVAQRSGLIRCLGQ